MCTPASPDGVASGEMGGEDEEVEELRDVAVPGEVGKDNPGGGYRKGLPWARAEGLVLSGRPCWKRQRVPLRQKPKAAKVWQKGQRGLDSLAVWVYGEVEFSPTLRLRLSTCRKLQREPKGQIPKEQKVRHGMFLRRRWAWRCSAGLWTNRQRLP